MRVAEAVAQVAVLAEALVAIADRALEQQARAENRRVGGRRRGTSWPRCRCWRSGSAAALRELVRRSAAGSSCASPRRSCPADQRARVLAEQAVVLGLGPLREVLAGAQNGGDRSAGRSASPPLEDLLDRPEVPGRDCASPARRPSRRSCSARDRAARRPRRSTRRDASLRRKKNAGAPDRVGAALRDGVDDAARAAAELGLVAGRDDLELLNRVLRVGLEHAAVEVVVVLEAVDEKRGVARALAEDGATRVAIAQVGRARCVLTIAPGREQDEVEIVAAVERDRLDLARGDDVRGRRRRRRRWRASARARRPSRPGPRPPAARRPSPSGSARRRCSRSAGTGIPAAWRRRCSGRAAAPPRDRTRRIADDRPRSVSPCTSMVTPGITPPVASVMVPSIVAVVVCPTAIRSTRRPGRRQSTIGQHSNDALMTLLEFKTLARQVAASA